jgi:antitoxin component YwqK of YwqJK toxin-antitoxin module
MGIDLKPNDSTLPYTRNGQKLPDGVRTGWYKNGQKWYEATYKDLKLNGLCTWWHDNGQKSSEGTYKDMKRDDVHTSWYESGQKKSEGTYKDGELISEEQWNEDGSVKE